MPPHPRILSVPPTLLPYEARLSNRHTLPAGKRDILEQAENRLFSCLRTPGIAAFNARPALKTALIDTICRFCPSADKQATESEVECWAHDMLTLIQDRRRECESGRGRG